MRGRASILFHLGTSSCHYIASREAHFAATFQLTIFPKTTEDLPFSSPHLETIGTSHLSVQYPSISSHFQSFRAMKIMKRWPERGAGLKSLATPKLRLFSLGSHIISSPLKSSVLVGWSHSTVFMLRMCRNSSPQSSLMKPEEETAVEVTGLSFGNPSCRAKLARLLW